MICGDLRFSGRPKITTLKKNLIIQDQYRVSLDCKRNPKRFWQYVNRKTATKTVLGDLRWKDSNGTTTVVETDKEKAEALQEFFHRFTQTSQTVNLINCLAEFQTNILIGRYCV